MLGRPQGKFRISSNTVDKLIFLQGATAYFHYHTLRDAVRGTHADPGPYALPSDNNYTDLHCYIQASTSTSYLPVCSARLRSEFPFDGMKGFGPWRIMIEHEARKALLAADGKLFRVFATKLQEMSNGYLYGDNMKKLEWHKTQLPVYEAKVTKNSRIVVRLLLFVCVFAFA